MAHTKQIPTGQQLVGDYQTIFVSMSTIQAAHYEAERSENSFVSQLNAMSAGTYLNPGAIAPDYQHDMTKASLDAHVKKVQAQQLDSMNNSQLQALSAHDAGLYKGRKVKVQVLTHNEQPIEMVWFDPQHGYRSNISKRPSVSGIIEEVLLDRNLLVLRPAFGSRMLNSSLKNILVYVINPDTMQPMISLNVS